MKRWRRAFPAVCRALRAVSYGSPGRSPCEPWLGGWRHRSASGTADPLKIRGAMLWLAKPRRITRRAE